MMQPHTHVLSLAVRVHMQCRANMDIRLGTLPLLWEDPSGSTGAHLVVLPSDHPSNRRDALAVQAFLAQLMHNPAQAAEM